MSVQGVSVAMVVGDTAALAHRANKHALSIWTAGRSKCSEWRECWDGTTGSTNGGWGLHVSPCV